MEHEHRGGVRSGGSGGRGKARGRRRMPSRLSARDRPPALDTTSDHDMGFYVEDEMDEDALERLATIEKRTALLKKEANILVAGNTKVFELISDIYTSLDKNDDGVLEKNELFRGLEQGNVDLVLLIRKNRRFQFLRHTAVWSSLLWDMKTKRRLYVTFTEFYCFAMMMADFAKEDEKKKKDNATRMAGKWKGKGRGKKKGHHNRGRQLASSRRSPAPSIPSDDDSDAFSNTTGGGREEDDEFVEWSSSSSDDDKEDPVDDPLYHAFRQVIGGVRRPSTIGELLNAAVSKHADETVQRGNSLLGAQGLTQALQGSELFKRESGPSVKKSALIGLGANHEALRQINHDCPELRPILKPSRWRKTFAEPLVNMKEDAVVSFRMFKTIVQEALKAHEKKTGKKAKPAGAGAITSKDVQRHNMMLGGELAELFRAVNNGGRENAPRLSIATEMVMNESIHGMMRSSARMAPLLEWRGWQPAFLAGHATVADMPAPEERHGRSAPVGTPVGSPSPLGNFDGGGPRRLNSASPRARSRSGASPSSPKQRRASFAVSSITYEEFKVFFQAYLESVGVKPRHQADPLLASNEASPPKGGKIDGRGFPGGKVPSFMKVFVTAVTEKPVEQATFTLKKRRAAFDSVDENHNGTLDSRELLAAVHQQHTLSLMIACCPALRNLRVDDDKSWRDVFLEMPTDAAGRVTFPKFCQFCDTIERAEADKHRPFYLLKENTDALHHLADIKGETVVEHAKNAAERGVSLTRRGAVQLVAMG